MSSIFDKVEVECSPKRSSKATYYLHCVKKSPWLCGLSGIILVAILLLFLKPSYCRDDENNILYSRIIIYSLVAGIIVAVLHQKFF